MKFCAIDKMHLGSFAGVSEAKTLLTLILFICFQSTFQFVCPIVRVGILCFISTRLIHFTQVCEFHDFFSFWITSLSITSQTFAKAALWDLSSLLYSCFVSSSVLHHCFVVLDTLQLRHLGWYRASYANRLNPLMHLNSFSSGFISAVSRTVCQDCTPNAFLLHFFLVSFLQKMHSGLNMTFSEVPDARTDVLACSCSSPVPFRQSKFLVKP